MERTQKLRIFGLGAGILAAAMWTFGVPLGTILLVGVWLLCPLMMMGMHGGHGNGSHEPHRPEREARRPEGTHERHGAPSRTRDDDRHG